MNYYPLKHLAIVHTGTYQKPAPGGRVLYLQAKHFDEQGLIKNQALLIRDIPMDTRVAKHLLVHNDLLLIAKGKYNQLCIYKEDFGPAVASSVFFVIRLQSEKILPEFLMWYFNSRRIQLKLTRKNKGTSIPSIAKSVVTEMEIPVPELATQQKILDIHQLWSREQQLARQLLQEKEQFYENTLMQLFQRTT
ncbi:MAG: hypothetical protein DHS20C18_41240 [Saprospiraceae bacterium]|nr:MAG: hypothetical protein DHS20C18_41240 [Saprospiraceae bacterium]